MIIGAGVVTIITKQECLTLQEECDKFRTLYFNEVDKIEEGKE